MLYPPPSPPGSPGQFWWPVPPAPAPAPAPRPNADRIWSRMGFAFALGVCTLIPTDIAAFAWPFFWRSDPFELDLLFIMSLCAPPVLIAVGALVLDRRSWHATHARLDALARMALLLLAEGVAIVGLVGLNQVGTTASGQNQSFLPGEDLVLGLGGFAGCVGFLAGCAITFAVSRPTADGARPFPVWVSTVAGMVSVTGMYLGTMSIIALTSLFDLAFPSVLTPECGTPCMDFSTTAYVYGFLFIMFGVCGLGLLLFTLPGAALGGLVGGALRVVPLRRTRSV